MGWACFAKKSIAFKITFKIICAVLVLATGIQ
jgi:hypothetical protein